MVAIVIVAGAFVFIAQQNAETARREADAADRGAEATLLAFASRDLLQRGDVAGATAAAVEAVTMLPTTETRSSLLQTVLALSPHLARSAVADDMRPGLVAFVPDTSQVLVGGSNGRLHLWDPAKGTRPAPFATIAQLESAGPQPPAIRALAATRVGGAVVLLDDGRLVRLDASGAPAGEVRLADDIGRAAAIARRRRPHHRRLAIGGGDRRLRLRRRYRDLRGDAGRRGLRVRPSRSRPTAAGGGGGGEEPA